MRNAVNDFYRGEKETGGGKNNNKPSLNHPDPVKRYATTGVETLLSDCLFSPVENSSVRQSDISVLDHKRSNVNRWQNIHT